MGVFYEVKPVFCTVWLPHSQHWAIVEEAASATWCFLCWALTYEAGTTSICFCWTELLTIIWYSSNNFGTLTASWLYSNPDSETAMILKSIFVDWIRCSSLSNICNFFERKWGCIHMMPHNNIWGAKDKVWIEF